MWRKTGDSNPETVADRRLSKPLQYHYGSLPLTMVRVAGVEPACLSTRDFKSLEYTNFSILACLVEAVRFELTDPFEPTVFKTVAISRTLPRFLITGGDDRIRTYCVS